MRWLSWFRSETFCCVFSLQSGTVVSIMVLAALGITSFVNIIYFLVTSSSYDEHIVPFCIVLTYLLILGVGLILAFLGAFSESRFWMLLGAIFTGIAILIYIAVAILSFLPFMYSTTCFSLRCPEHLWLQPSYWREVYRDYNETDEGGGSNMSLIEEKEIFSTTLYTLPTTTKLIIHRRLRPNPITRAYSPDVKERGPYLVGGEEEEEVDKEVLLCDKSARKLSDESEQDAEYCPEGYEAADDSGMRTYSIVTSIVYLLCFAVFQLYCLYGFLCFANELGKELG